MTAIPEINTIRVGDCLDLLPTLPDDFCQLVIADPPYNLGKTFGNGRTWQSLDEWLPWCDQWLAECVRLLSDGGNLFVYGIHHYLAFLHVRLFDMGMAYRRQIIWYYENGFSAYTRSPAAHYEPILWFSKGDDYTYHAIREPYKSTERLKYKVKKGGKTWTPHPEGRRAGDVWQFPTLAGRRFRDEKVDHPTQKPLALTDRIVKHFSNPKDIVLVPFAGSGTECLSARDADRSFWACEIEQEYVDLANRRLEVGKGARGDEGASQHAADSD